MKKITFILGARPNIIKAAPIYHALLRRQITPDLIYTGQHSDHAMMGTFAEFFRLPQHISLNALPSANARMVYISSLTTLIQAELQRLRPDMVLVFGDVNSSLAGARAAKNLGIELAHIESGLRSGDMDMPEEHNRMEIDQLADWLFTTEPSGSAHLMREGRNTSRIFQCGNTMIDALKQNLPKAIKKDTAPVKSYAWMSLHRPANTDTAQAALRSLHWVEAVSRLIQVYIPVHPRLRNKLQEHGLWSQFCALPNTVETGPLSYLENLVLMSEAAVLITDSGGVQEEAVGLSIPCITLRTSTERPITIDCGINQLLPEPSPQDLIAAVKRILDAPTVHVREPEGWDGNAAERIVEVLVG